MPVDGVIYRELCRQVPSWSALAGAEIDNPIDAEFIEYLVVQPGTDLAKLKAVPEGYETHYELTEDLHSVAFRFVKPPTGSRPGALMFNLFEIDGPAGMEQGFLMDWPPRGEFKIREDATLSTMLHQRMLPKATFKAFNRAEVTSAEGYAEGIARFEQAFPRRSRKAAADGTAASKPPIRSHLGLFGIVALGVAGSPLPITTMRAVECDTYGPPEVLQVKQVTRPKPGPGQILVRVIASSINPLDVKMRSGEVQHIYPSFFPDVFGYSVSGIVEEVGEGVTDRKRGEEVYGINNPIMRHGYAEFVVAPASFFYPKPAKMSFAIAAAAPSVFATAFGGLFLRANLKAGQTVLIHGGSGVIGSCAVQLAKQVGATVIATASTSNVERVRKLGADVVVDYKTQRFEDLAHGVDMVFDTVGGETRERSWAVLRKGGVLASLLPPPPDPVKAESYGVQAFMVHGHPDIAEIMPEMTRRLETGELAFPEIAATYPLENAAEAHAAFEKSSPRGRIVLLVE
jgi:NADPH:quinone reductase-like Zn-dependent oxidoreductase